MKYFIHSLLFSTSLFASIDSTQVKLVPETSKDTLSIKSQTIDSLSSRLKELSFQVAELNSRIEALSGSLVRTDSTDNEKLWVDQEREERERTEEAEFQKKQLRKYSFRLSAGIGLWEYEYNYNISKTRADTEPQNIMEEDTLKTNFYQLGFELGYKNGVYFRYAWSDFMTMHQHDDVDVKNIGLKSFDFGYLKKVTFAEGHNLRLMAGPSILWVRTKFAGNSRNLNPEEVLNRDNFYWGVVTGVGYESDLKKLLTLYSDLNIRYTQGEYASRDLNNINYSLSLGVNINIGLIGKRKE